jgi:hypothetical protein
MSKVLELIRPEQAIKGFDKKNLSKSTLEALNRIEREYVQYKYRDMVTFQDNSSFIVTGFGNFMSKNERFIIPEIFPAKAETDKIGFQRFALPMIRNINNAESYVPFFNNPDYQEVKYEMEVLSTRNYVAYEFYPYDIPVLQAIDDTLLKGVLIAIDVGAATKVRFWRTGGKVIRYNLSYSLITNFRFHENPYPLFEYDVVPYTRNYIYLNVGTTVSDYYFNGYQLFPFAQLIDQTGNINNDVYSPRIKMELFSEDYSAQRFESGITAGNDTSFQNPVFNISNELCVVVKINGFLAGNGNANINIYEPLYSESTIPNFLNNKVKSIQEPFSSIAMNKIKLPIKHSLIQVTSVNISPLYYTIEPR